MGLIYLITNTVTGKLYIGQTIQTLEERWKGHKYAARRILQDKNDCKGNSYFYNSMNKHGIENFVIDELIEVPDNELDEMEIHFIKKFNTLQPHGYNLQTGGGHFTHHENTKKLMSEKAVLAAPSYIDLYRKEETKGLPMYIVSHNKGTARGYAVCGHPLCSYKSFTVGKLGSMECCKIAAIKFLNKLSVTGDKHTHQKANPELPMGITKFRTGYLAKRKINGIVHRKVFEGKLIPDEVKLNNAIEFLNSLPK